MNEVQLRRHELSVRESSEYQIRPFGLTMTLLNYLSNRGFCRIEAWQILDGQSIWVSISKSLSNSIQWPTISSLIFISIYMRSYLSVKYMAEKMRTRRSFILRSFIFVFFSFLSLLKHKWYWRLKKTKS